MTSPNLTIVEIKAFIPARDFDRSMAFYEALGFTRASLGGGLAYFHLGLSSFLLQDFFVREHAGSFVMHLLVENVDDWHRNAKPVAAQFDVAIGEPEDREGAMGDFTLVDPSGVLWRIGQNIPRVDAV